MLASSFTVFVLTMGTLVLLGGLGVVGGIIISEVRYNRFMKVFNADVDKSRFDKVPN